MAATSTAELRAHARAVRARLFAPANAVVDRGIDLRRPKPVEVMVETLPVAEVILWSPPQRPMRPFMSTARIVKLVADFYKVPLELILSPDRHAPVVRARHVAAYLTRDLFRRSFPEIGRAVGINHSTVIIALQSFAEKLRADHELAYQVEQLRHEILDTVGA